MQKETKPGHARCRYCGLLPVEDFYKDQSRRGTNTSSECKDCFRKRTATIPVTKKRDYRAGNLKKSFGITVDQYDEMAEAQQNLCAICGNLESAIDYLRRTQ